MTADEERRDIRRNRIAREVLGARERISLVRRGSLESRLTEQYHGVWRAATSVERRARLVQLAAFALALVEEQDSRRA